jgi:YtkA-like
MKFVAISTLKQLVIGVTLVLALSACGAAPKTDTVSPMPTGQAMAMHSPMPTQDMTGVNPDWSTTQISELGVYKATYTSRLDPIAINQIHTWVLHVEAADGNPVVGAQISVDGGMPQHNHGLPTQPQVTQDLGNGDYQVEGLKFQMPGWWVVKFKIAANGQTDVATFNLMLN